MKELYHQLLNETNKVFIMAEKIRSAEEDITAGYIGITYKAQSMLRSIYFELTSEDIYDGLKFGHGRLKKYLSDCMIAKKHFRKDLLPVMVQTVRDDSEFAYKFIYRLPKHLSRDGLIDIIGTALQSQHANTRWIALTVTKEISLIELLPSVKELMQSPDNLEAEFASDICNLLKT